MDAQPGDEALMLDALAEARLAEAAGEVPIGAIVTAPDGTVLSRGQNSVIRLHDPSAHAEILALRAAGVALGNYRLTGCALYVTLEPCAMCAGAMTHARIARLIFGAHDPKAGAVESVLAVINHRQSNHRVEVTGGTLKTECGEILKKFFHNRR